MTTPEGRAPTVLDNEAARRRRAVIDASPGLRALADRLDRQLDGLRTDPVYVPEAKALLTREGGVCPEDGSRLAFDPFQPHEHRCPACGAVHRGALHHRAWIWRYQVWLSERAVHFAVLGALGVAADGAARAADLLSAYAGRYRAYPNRDNVLGPTRLFFSTYLESIWLLQLAAAATVLRATAPDRWTGIRAAVEAMVAESAALIASYDEGYSNRQVWNNAAMLAAAQVLGDGQLRTRALDGRHGLERLLTDGVGAGGRWHEGENYHFFALRGFQFAAEGLRGAEPERMASMDERLTAMAVAPLDTLLPDLSFPARGDSPFGVSVRQARFADLWELAWARSGHPRLEAVLSALYAGAGPTAMPGVEEIAEQEVHRPGHRLDRWQLGWRALLWMRPDPPAADPGGWAGHSLVVPPAGPAVLRTGGRYVAVETGTGRGHGHPDVLHLTLEAPGVRMVDPGTGSYVAPSLHWYRSTLAHNAPGIAGVGQAPGEGVVRALEEAAGAAWTRVEAVDILGPGSRAVRSVVMTDRYLVDVLDVDVPDTVVVDLPVHVHGGIDGGPGRRVSPADLGTGNGYDHVTVPVRTLASAEPGTRAVILAPREGETVYRATAPGPPSLAFADGPPERFLLRRAAGPGRWASAVDLGAGIRSLRWDGPGLRVDHEEGWEVVTLEPERVTIRRRGGAEIVLSGPRRPVPPAEARPAPVPAVVPCPRLAHRPEWSVEGGLHDELARVRLDASHYRRSEDAYPGPDRFAAEIGWGAGAERFWVLVDVTKDHLCLFDDRTAPALDNDPPGIHADGVQVYWAGPGDVSWEGALCVPRADGSVTVSPAGGTRWAGCPVVADWSRTGSGYRMRVGIDPGGPPNTGDRMRLQVVVNEGRRGRDRRAGQLALGGGGGWVYLRGDRESPASAVLLEVQ